MGDKRSEHYERMALYEQFQAALEHENAQAAGWMGYLVLEIKAKIPALGIKGAMELACMLVLRPPWSPKNGKEAGG